MPMTPQEQLDLVQRYQDAYDRAIHLPAASPEYGQVQDTLRSLQAEAERHGYLFAVESNERTYKLVRRDDARDVTPS